MYVNPIPMIDAGKTFVLEIKMELPEVTEVEDAKAHLADFLQQMSKEELIKWIRCKEIKALYPDDLK